MNPDEKILVIRPGHGSFVSDQTHADVTLGPLTAEALRDIARNESASKPWRKAAVKFLLARQHGYAQHPEFKLLLAEIREEQEAEEEVQSVVESATEEPLES